MLPPHSIAGMPPRPATTAEAGRKRRARGLFRRATSGSGLQTSGSYWGSPAPTQCLCQLRKLDSHVFGEFPFPGARSDRARTRGPCGHSRRAHGVQRPRAPRISIEEAPEGGTRPVGGGTTAWPGRQPRRENSSPVTGAMPSRTSESTNVKAKYRFWYEVEARD